jgi:hypothetical protein
MAVNVKISPVKKPKTDTQDAVKLEDDLNEQKWINN